MTAGLSHSVCVVTYERPAVLTRCLESLAAHVSNTTQIVVVDASTSPSAEAVVRIRPSIRYVHAPHLAGWMTRSRNEALRHVSGDVVSFIDDDVVVSDSWQPVLLDVFADPSVHAVAGRTRNLQPGEERYALPIGLLRPDGTLTDGFASLPSGIVEVDHGIGANMSFRRDVLARLGGFRDDYPGTAMREDTDVYLRIKRMGGRAVFVPAAVVDHLPAPHVKGKRFDTRYKLYGRRNHMVMLARYDGIRSPMLRRWVAVDLRAVREAPSAIRWVRRLGVTVIGLAWGAVAMLRQARWKPMNPERNDPAAQELRTLLSRGPSSLREMGEVQ